MVKKNEISSTERLLSLIRKKGDVKKAPSDPTPLAPTPPIKKSSSKRPFGKGKSVTLGLDFGLKQLRMAAITTASDSKPVFSNFQTVPYEKGLNFGTPRFSLFLKQTLDNFCQTQRKVRMWSSIPSINVETKFLRIPKVSKKQLANSVFWTHKRESNIDEKESVFDFQILGESVDKGLPRIDVVSYTAPKHEVEKLKRVFSKAGYPLTGLSIVPFALQNLFRTGWTETGGKNVCTLFIGTDWSRIAVFSENNLMLSRDIKAGVQSMTEAIAEELEKTNLAATAPWEENQELSLVESPEDTSLPFSKQAHEILNRFIRNDPEESEEGDDSSFNNEEVFNIIAPGLDRIVRQVERTLDHYYLNYEKERVSKVCLSGSVCSHQRLVDHISDQLAIPVDFIDPFYSAISNAVSVVGPETAQERGDYVPAVGMALGKNSYTPNFLYTYKDREKTARLAGVNRLIFSVGIVFMMVCAGYFVWQNKLLDQKRNQAAKQQQHLDSFIPRVDQNMILELATHSLGEQQSIDIFAEKYKGMAIIGEVVKITPSSIRLSGMSIQLGGINDREKVEESGDDKEKIPEKVVLVHGFVSGERLNFESALAGYMVNLERSPMFRRPVILNKGFETLVDGEILKFTAQVEII